jgi:hypothetical protein
MPYSTENQITIEKTPKYFIDGEAPQRAHTMNPNLKIIIIVRNPVTRAISEYVQSKENKKKKFKNLNSNDNVDDDSDLFAQMLYQHNQTSLRIKWPVVRNGLYIENLKRWLEFFPIEQFLFVNGEQLIRDPSVEINKLQDFLNLERLIKKEHFVMNKEKGFACINKPLDSNQIKCLNDQKGRRHPQMNSTIINDLENFYEPFNKDFFHLIKQEPFW